MIFVSKLVALIAGLITFVSETDLLQDAAFEIVASCGRVYWAADQSTSLNEASDLSRYFDRVDLICPEASMNGAVDVMRCHRALENSAVNWGMWERRQYASVVLLVPDAYGWTVP